MGSVFKADRLQEEFERNGYLVLPLLNNEQIEQIAAFYRHTDKEGLTERGFHVTIHSDSPAYRKKVSETIGSVVENPLMAILDRHRIAVANFVVKEPGVESGFPAHQDWAYVDERRFMALNIWCPLVDVNEHNGNLWILRESHKNIVAIRGSNAPHLPHYFSLYENIDANIKSKYQASLTLKAGEAVFYDTRMVHFSPPNQTQETRVAINILVIPAEASLVHYYRNSEDQVEIFSVYDDFLTEFKVGEKPTGISIGQIDYHFSNLYPEQTPTNSAVKPTLNPRSSSEPPAIGTGNVKNWHLIVHNACQADLLCSDHSPSVMRLQIAVVDQSIAWEIQLACPELPIHVDQAYTILFSARAESPRSINVAVGRAHAPWDEIGIYSEVQLNDQWQKFTLDFIATDSDNNGRLYFDVGACAIDVELKDISIKSHVISHEDRAKLSRPNRPWQNWLKSLRGRIKKQGDG